MNVIGKYKAKKTQDADVSIILKSVFKKQACREVQTYLIYLTQARE
jgi:hypothetical protein